MASILTHFSSMAKWLDFLDIQNVSKSFHVFNIEGLLFILLIFFSPLFLIAEIPYLRLYIDMVALEITDLFYKHEIQTNI